MEHSCRQCSGQYAAKTWNRQICRGCLAAGYGEARQRAHTFNESVRQQGELVRRMERLAIQEKLADNPTMDTKLPVGHAALEGAIEKMTLAGLARAIEVDYQLIQGWRVKSRKYATPAEYCQAVAQKSGIPLHELRPDIYPSPQQQGPDMDPMSRAITAAEAEQIAVRLLDERQARQDRASICTEFHCERDVTAVMVDASLHVERIGDVLIIRRGVI